MLDSRPNGVLRLCQGLNYIIKSLIAGAFVRLPMSGDNNSVQCNFCASNQSQPVSQPSSVE